MKCSELDQDILLLQHGELSAWRAFCVKHHMQSCPRCQDKSESFRQVGRDIAATIRQDGMMAPFVFRGEPQPTAPQIRKVTSHALRLRPSVAIGATAIATIIAAGAYAYRAMALTPTTNIQDAPRLVFVGANRAGSNGPKDANGHETIFPYSTPSMDDHCVK